MQAVQIWLRSAGFTVDYTPSNGHYVTAEGTVAKAHVVADAPPSAGFRNSQPCSAYWAEKVFDDVTGIGSPFDNAFMAAVSGN